VEAVWFQKQVQLRQKYLVQADEFAARYIRTGTKIYPTLEGLRRTSSNMREGVGDFLRDAGIAVRL